MADYDMATLRTHLLALAQEGRIDDRVLISGIRTDETGAFRCRFALRPRPGMGPKGIAERECRWCAKTFIGRSTAKYCSNACSQKHYRDRNRSAL